MDIVEVLAALILIMPPIHLLWGAFREERDNNKIVNLLESEENGWTWRSTHAISAKTNIPKDRVRKLCGWHNKITQSEKREGMWRLAE